MQHSALTFGQATNNQTSREEARTKMRDKVLRLGLQIALLGGLAAAFASGVVSLQASAVCQIKNGVCVHPNCEQCDTSCRFCVL